MTPKDRDLVTSLKFAEEFDHHCHPEEYAVVGQRLGSDRRSESQAEFAE